MFQSARLDSPYKSGKLASIPPPSLAARYNTSFAASSSSSWRQQSRSFCPHRWPLLVACRLQEQQSRPLAPAFCRPTRPSSHRLLGETDDSHCREARVLLQRYGQTTQQRSRRKHVRCQSHSSGSRKRSPPVWPLWLQRLAKALPILRPARILFNIIVLLFLLRVWPISGRSTVGHPQPVVVAVPFSEFLSRVKDNDVSLVSIDGQHLSFALRSSYSQKKALPEGSEKVRVMYTTVRPADYATPYELMLKKGVQFSAVDKRGNRFFTVMVYALYIGLLLSALNRLPLRLPRGGPGRRHQAPAAQQAISFDDVAGVDEAKEELMEIVELLKSPEKFSKLGARAPSGVLLVGPPGTGKTLLAKAVAGEANVPFFSISASEFVELYVGMGAMRVRELFALARKEAPSIVFIDEIDAVAKGRDTRLRSVGNDEREQTLNQLLTELDGFESGPDGMVICIAATNRPDVLDPALLRPGRFDRRVAVERPDRQGREEILRVHIQRRELPLNPNVEISTVAAATTGFTGAELANLVNEAALLAGRSNKDLVELCDFEQAILRSVAGIEKKRSILVGLEKAIVARHEVGHALCCTAVARLIPGANEVETLSIIPRSGGALGFTYIPLKTEDRALMFDSEIRGQLVMLMGGRAAEMLSCGEVSTGAVDDLRRATDLAYKAVAEYGLCAAVGPMSLSSLNSGGSDDGAMLLRDSGHTSRIVESEVKSLLEAALSAAKDVITANRAVHDKLSRDLESFERLSKAELEPFLQQVAAPNSLREFVLTVSEGVAR